MPLTARQIAQDCLAHINKELTASTPFSGLPTGAEAYLVNTLNLALEEMRSENPGMFRQTLGVVFEEPKSGTVSVTQGSQSLYLGTLAQPASNGCTALIEGDPVYHELRASGSELGDYLLLHAYGGETGTREATVWGDAATVETHVDQILGGIVLADRRPLKVINNRMDWLRFKQWGLGDYGSSEVASVSRERQPGTPEAVWVETHVDADAERIETRVRCAPMPSAQFAVELEVQTIPTEVSAADLNEEAAFYFPIPGQRVYTIFRALALYHWSGSPWFANDKARTGIERGYAKALETLRGYRAHPEAGAQLIVEGI